MLLHSRSVRTANNTTLPDESRFTVSDKMAGLAPQQVPTHGPVLKRQRVQSDSGKVAATPVRQSKIFAPFRVSFTSAADEEPQLDP